MAYFILAFGERRQFSMHPWGFGDPVSFGESTHIFTVRVEFNEAEYGVSVGLRDVVVGFDDASGV